MKVYSPRPRGVGLGFRDYLCLEVAHRSQEPRALVLRHIPAPVRIHGIKQGMGLNQFREPEPSRYAEGGRGADVVGGVEEVLVVPVAANLRRFRDKVLGVRGWGLGAGGMGS